MSHESHLEIERVWLARACPELPRHAKRLVMHQGYFAPPKMGRLRMTTFDDGTRSFVHTLKTGEGLVRHETEHALSEAEFQQAWPATEGQRLSKTRWRVDEGELTWEIDVFDEIDLVLAEVELPTVLTSVSIPVWLAGVVEREVTEEKAYRNFALVGRHLTQGHPKPWIG